MRLASLLVLSLVASLILFTGVANATSDYDDVFAQAPTLIANEVPCGASRDFSLDWFEYATDESKMIYPNDPNVTAQRVALLNSIQNGGYHFVLKHPSDSGYIVVFSHDSNAKLEFFWGGGPLYRMVSTNGSSNISAVHVTTRANRYGLSACGEWGLGEGYMVTMNVFNAGYNYPTGHPIFINSFPTDYPDGYDGVYIQSEYVPPAPITTHHTGTVDCFDTTPPAQMLIYQDGNSDPATLSASDLPGKATWDYNFTSSPYSIAVQCGANWTYSYGTVTEMNANWYCDPNGEYLHECQLG